MRTFIRWAVLCGLLVGLVLLPMTLAQKGNGAQDQAPDNEAAKPADNNGGDQKGDGQHRDGQHGNGQHGDGQHGDGQHRDGQHGNKVDDKAPAAPATNPGTSPTPSPDRKRAELEKQIEVLRKQLDDLQKQLKK
jgi:hypothetical protein